MTRLLVVEDNPVLCEFVRDALEQEGYQVQTAPDGQAALACLAAMRPGGPDAILLDMNMPELDGWGFAAAYRRTATPPPHARLIVMTAGTDADGACRDIAGDACLPKPFDLEDLFRAVQGHAPRAA